MQKIAKKSFSVLMASLVVSAVLTSTVSADPVNVRPVAGASLGSLDTIFNGASGIVTSGPDIDVTDQSTASHWTNDGSGGAVATFIIELAGRAGTNTFGIYDASDSGNTAELFAGSAVAGSTVLVSFLANGDIVLNGDVAHPVATGFASPSNFGFYLGVSGTPTFFTQDHLNPSGDPQALVYQGGNGTSVTVDPFGEGAFDDDDWIIAFEDLVFGAAGTDKDFNDLVVIVSSLTAVPAPGALLLGVIGMGGIGWVRRRMA